MEIFTQIPTLSLVEHHWTDTAMVWPPWIVLDNCLFSQFHTRFLGSCSMLLSVEPSSLIEERKKEDEQRRKDEEDMKRRRDEDVRRRREEEVKRRREVVTRICKQPKVSSTTTSEEDEPNGGRAAASRSRKFSNLFANNDSSHYSATGLYPVLTKKT